MRIIAIGIGGAGCRIVNSLYAIDRRSSNVACVQGLAIDVDEQTIRQLNALPENARMCFSADAGLDPTGNEPQTAPIDINEIISRVQNLESGENDAIIICCGLGGSMTDIAPHIIAGLRSSVVEPIFGLVTLPCLAEGKRVSGKAADDIDMLSSLLDGIIVFDNETWHKKIKTQKDHLPKKERGFAEKIGLIKSEKVLPPTQAAYSNLNEVIVRRIALMLRAGEFRADGGIDLAEVVLDSGEVLNTMKGMGFITIGYAVEKLTHDPLRFLSWLKPAGLSDEEQKKRASRIVELAKQAIYHEISTPCDLTSAHKALVLVAGPSHELSMKGFMTVRKWIDRSIAGLETRSGDYPVMNTKNVAIIVMLSGLENIPRITELREIRSESKPKKQEAPKELPEEFIERDKTGARDDMISLPVRRVRADDINRKSHPREAPGGFDTSIPTEGAVTIPQNELRDDNELPLTVPAVVPEVPRKAPSERHEPVPEPLTEKEHRRIPEELVPSRRRVVVAHADRERPYHASSHTLPVHGSPRPGKTGIPVRSVPETPAGHLEEEIPPAKETERQRIERELRRQRSMAIGGQSRKIPVPAVKTRDTVQEKRIIHHSTLRELTIAEDQIPQQANETAAVSGERRTIIIGKRKTVTPSPDEEAGPARDKSGPAFPQGSDDENMSVEIRDRVFQAKDDVFEGKEVQKPPLPQARDSTLLHTELRSKKKASDRGVTHTGDIRDDPPGKDPAPVKKRIRSDKKT